MKYRLAGPKKKMPKALKAALIAAAAVLTVLYVLGITLGSDSETKASISQAVEENRTLRNELTAKDSRINDLEYEVRTLNEEIARLNDVIAAIPTPTPTPEPYVQEEEVSPRYYDEDE